MTKIIKHNFHQSIIRSYDIRGEYNKTLFDSDAKVIGILFGLELGKRKTVNVAYDGRKSSLSLKENLIEGLLESGINVIEIGLVPTPLLYFSCFELISDGGIMVTGSHNPKNHNGFKFVKNNGPFFGEELKKFEKKAKKFMLNEPVGSRKKVNLKKNYIDRVFKGFKQEKKLNVVWDSGNGAAGEIMVGISKVIEGKKKILYEKIDGNFPNHHPDPSEPKNLECCKKEILKNKFDVGFAFDGDGDRLGVVDDLGRIVPGDKILLILAKSLCKKKKATVIGDVKCSQVLFDEIKKIGGKVIMSKTGHSHVKNGMKKYNADLAGEMSGHIFFGDDYYGYDDAIFASIKFLEILNTSKKKLSEIVDEIPKVFNTPEIRVECPDEVKFDIISKIAKNLNKKNIEVFDLDGLRVNSKDGWWLLRASNTQPALVARCESLTKKGLEYQKFLVKEEIKKVDELVSRKIFS